MSVRSPRPANLILGEEGTDLSLKISGVLDESVGLRALLAHEIPRHTSAKRLLLDLSEVARLNSTGVREWISFLEELKPILPYEIHKANELMILQSITVYRVMGEPGTPVHQIEVPYFCKVCRKRTTRWLKSAEIQKAGEVHLPPVPCSHCRKPLELDTVAEDYFAFLIR